MGLNTWSGKRMISAGVHVKSEWKGKVQCKKKSFNQYGVFKTNRILWLIFSWV